MSKRTMCCFLLPFVLLSCRPADSSRGEERQDARARMAVLPEGSRTANIQTSAGSYLRPVRISDGKVHCVQWSEAHCVPFTGELSIEGTAAGILQTGEIVKLELLD